MRITSRAEEGGKVNKDSHDDDRIITKKWLYWTLAGFIVIIVLLAIGVAIK